MQTPIYDFVQNYINSGMTRFHMPGHKGKSFLGIEPLDITEIKGADELYSPSGIIAESEENATKLFGTAHTYYSTEGSTLAIKAMLAIAMKSAPSKKNATVLAARNAHKAFLYSAALLDFDIEWLYPEESSHLCKCEISPAALEASLEKMIEKPFAVYLTSPDYLGNIADIKGLSKICDKYGIPLLVDNAHGAYLAFLEPSLHPIALGASMCADSAHKTLPVLTGGAYLHIAKKAEHLTKYARSSLSLFASTSPSYLILQSLDLANAYIADGYAEKLHRTRRGVASAKGTIQGTGFAPEKTEPLKIVIHASKYGYTGDELAEHLRENGIECEFSDRDYLVLMATPENDEDELKDYEKLYLAFMLLSPKPEISEARVSVQKAPMKMSVREAIFSQSERVATRDALGRILASPTVSCPPAVPIAISGEEITESVVKALLSYGINELEVVK